MIPASLVGGVIRQARKDAKEGENPMTRTGREFALRLNACEILEKPKPASSQFGGGGGALEPPTSCPGRFLPGGYRLPPISLEAKVKGSTTSRQQEKQVMHSLQKHILWLLLISVADQT
jgi:hypothetical protein